ncbi:amino acid adenylation domain-containing protein [Amycolatopsis sp. WGS_07]|uniref:amino acid adenylation domain-containing protein n=1 Tax=Amycolatopsis sp. WGS_07 TaxID=3076764 RepID=UPI003873AF4F
MTTEQSRRAELLQRYLANAAPARPAAAMRADRGRPLPLSPAQQRVWVLDRLRPGGTEYVVTAAWRLRGPLDVARLRACWQTIVSRHEILRTTYAERDGVPEQLVGEPGVDLTVRDVAAEDVESVTREAASVPFDLSRDRPLRIRVLRQSATEHVLLLVVHHIAYDGWSTSVVARELGALYSGETLPELPVQYADFASWHRTHAVSDRVSEQVEFWRRRLDGVVPLTLPTDRPRPPVHDPRGETLRFTVDAELGAAVAALGRAHRATTFMVLLAAYQILLSRYSGQSDVTVGTPVAGRTRAESQDLIGLFLNTLVLRASVDGSLSFQDFLDRVRRDTLDAYANQDAPFERLADELAPERDLSRNPLFQAMLVLQNTASAGFEAAGVSGEQVHSPWHSAKFDLTLELTERPDGSLDGVLEYPVALFDRDTIARMAGHFTELLRGIVADPGARLAELPWLRDAELARWNETDVAYPSGTLLSLVAEGVTARVVADGVSVSYVELDALSNQAAHWLRSRGVGLESVVGVRLERGLEMVVALVGILKAGAAYLPLDPDYPEDRLRFMVEDSGTELVIEPGDLTGLNEPVSPVDVLVRPENAAYVIYTSGSTGRPKGVVVEHRGIVNRLRWMQAEYGLAPDDRVLQKTPFGFDVSVWEFFWTLSAGATLVMARPGGHRDPAYLAEVMAEGITTAHFVPSMLRAFLAEPVPSLRRVLCSGEALPDELAERFHRVIGAELHNLYGPTEASVDVTADRCLPGEPVTIGRAIANTRVFVVDAELREVPVGVPGELVIAGVQLARGYLNRPSLTAEKFVPDPFARTPGERLYRTGDLARRLPDGRIEYRGRLDHQVKIHGNRIELGEVETTLLTHPDLRAAAAAVHDDRLIGYFVPEPGWTPDPAALRAHLARTLPEPMLPSVWVELAELPLTASGKTDRNALPAPEGERTTQGYVAPRTPAEASVARAFAAATDVDRVGAEDSFFALGGDSLRAIRAVGLLRAEGIEANVADLFRQPRVADFAAGLGGPAGAVEVVEPFAQLTEDQRRGLPDDVTDAYPLSLAQAGMVHEMLAGADRGLYLNHLGYPVHEEFRLDALQQAANRLVARHEILRTSIDFAAVPALQRVHETARLTVTCDDLRALSADDQAERVRRFPLEDRARGFDLLRPPLLRLHVHWLGDREWRLSFSYVHAILDGWSQNSLVAELISDYRSGAAGPVSPPPVRFADTVARERVALESTVDREFWSDRVRAAERFTVPSGWAGEDDGIYRTVRVPFDDLAPQLRSVASSAGVPLKSLLLAAHLTVLRTVAGHDRPFQTGVVTNSRLERAGGDEVRGMFLNTVPFAVPSDARDWPELARAVFAEETAMWPHRHFPLPAMQAAWGGQIPLVDVFFNHTDMHVLAEALVDLAEVADSTPNEFGLSVSTVPGAFVLEAFTHRISLVHMDFLARLYRHVLERIVTAPTSNPRRSGLPSADRAALLRNPARTPVFDQTLPELFAVTAAGCPAAVALRCGDVTLTYQELSVRVGKLAGYLRDSGVRRGSLVGVLLDRGPALLVALLAVHRAGAAYVPIDPRYPAKRVGYVLADSGVEVVISEEPLAGLLAETACSTVLVDRDAAAIEGGPVVSSGRDAAVVAAGVAVPSGRDAAAGGVVLPGPDAAVVAVGGAVPSRGAAAAIEPGPTVRPGQDPASVVAGLAVSPDREAVAAADSAVRSEPGTAVVAAGPVVSSGGAEAAIEPGRTVQPSKDPVAVEPASPVPFERDGGVVAAGPLLPSGRDAVAAGSALPSGPDAVAVGVRPTVPSGSDAARADVSPAPPGRDAAAIEVRVPGREGSAAVDTPNIPVPRPHGDELAYAIYTSGSTGQPKGVQITHAALANFLLSMRDRPGLAPGAAVLALTTVSFDISALELYLPLLVGGQVILASAEECVDPQRQAALIERTGPSVVQATPSGLRLLVDSGWTPPAGLAVFSGGEKLPGDLARRLTAGGARLWDLYGPTETTIWSTVAELGRDAVVAWEPVANTDVYLLGDDLEPVPLGVVGEVWIGGDGLARGYAGRPGLTAERFAPDPHGVRPGGRLYRTGDLARRRPDGSVEILGRADDQVKVRGHRVEPGEVEAVLRADPRVRDAVVQPSATLDGVELTAYVVARGELSIADVRKGLSGTLPDYLVPSGFVLLPELPRTPAGKLDRAALPAPEPAVRERSHVAPRGPVEEMVAGVWAEVLGIERIGARDDFFDLGGHSVAATRISVRLRAALDADVPVRALFDHPTVEALAAAVAGYPRLASEPAARATIRPRARVSEDV